MQMLKLIRQQKGFSLIEVIVVLILVGLLAPLASLGIVSIVKSFIFTKTTAEVTLKGQVAITILAKEFSNASDITVNSSSDVTYSVYRGTLTPETHQVHKSGTEILINTDILIDKVNNFSVTYDATNKLIDISITLIGPDGTNMSFSDRITPRNM